MSAAALGATRPAGTCGTSGESVDRSGHPRNGRCPWPCVHAGRVVALYDGRGEPQATWCRDCDQTVSRLGWLAELDRAAGDRA
jgi:hypothetical protein